MVNSQSHVALPSSRPRARGFIVASTLLFGVGIALAAPGDLDPSFNGSGLLSLNIGNSGSRANAVVQQSDGKLVLAGESAFSFTLVRLTAGGTPDSTFGTNGIANADFAGGIARAVIQQTDGKLVLAGSAASANGAEDIALARFDADGTLDASFGNGGKVTLDIGGSADFASGLIQQPGGNFVIAGGTNSGGPNRLVLARFNVNGTLDVTFGTGGTTLVDFGGGSESWANAIAQQQDGELIAAGRVFGPTSQDIGIARVTANGALDPSFAGDGLLVVDNGGSDEEAYAVAIQPDDSIVAVGYTSSSGGSPVSALLLRVKGNGSFDGGFGISGRSVIDLGGDSILNSIVVQANGQLIATGSLATNVGGEDMILARFNSDGALDTSYGIDGVSTADFGTGDTAHLSLGVALIQQADGKYVAAGPNSLGTFGAARFDDGAAFPGRVGFTSTSAFIVETTAKVSYTVRRTGGTTGAVSVNYATAAGQAQPGSDFEDTSGTLTWNDGDASDKTITVNIFDDAAAESNEDFLLTLSGPTGGAQLAASEASTTIGSDDGPGQLGFADFFGQFYGETAEGRKTTARVFRINGSQGAISVSYSTKSGTATAGTDFVATSGTLNWADGDTNVKQIEVQTLQDSVAEGEERFEIQLSNPTGGATFAGTPGGGANDHRLVIIGDNNAGLGFSSSAASIGEAGGSVSLAVSRSGAANGVVSVNYATSSGSATAGSDFTSASGTLDWADGDTADKKITVNVTNDTTDEANETFTVTLSNPSVGTGLGSNSSTTVTIVDDDAPAGGGGGGDGGGGALDWFAALFLACLIFLRRRRAFQLI